MLLLLLVPVKLRGLTSTAKVSVKKHQQGGSESRRTTMLLLLLLIRDSLPNLPFFFSFLIAVALISSSPSVNALDHAGIGGGGVGRRVLMSFKESPRGSNLTFDCSPSGPCVPCQYSEKSDDKYRCSETGYRIPFKCVEIKDGGAIAKDNNNGKKPQKSRSAADVSQSNANHGQLTSASKEHRVLDEDPSTPEGGTQAYITYRSCLPAVNEEKLSVLGFEGVILCLLLISGSVIYFRRKQSSVTMPGVGAVRIQTNSRF